MFGGVETLEAEYRHHRFTPHGQETAVIGVVQHGSALVYGAGAELTLNPGSVLVIPPGVLHGAHSVGPDIWHYRAFYFTAPQLTRLLPLLPDGEGLLGTRPVVLDGGDVADQVLAMHAMLTDTASTEASAEDSVVALLERLHRCVIRSSPLDTKARRIAAGISRVRRLIDEDPLTRRSLGEMAREANLGRFTFAHAFSSAFGIAPHAYSLQRKVAAVRALLASGEEVSSVAHRVGFADQSHLTRRFLSVVGVTPGEFRRAWQRRESAQ